MKFHKKEEDLFSEEEKDQDLGEELFAAEEHIEEAKRCLPKESLARLERLEHCRAESSHHKQEELQGFQSSRGPQSGFWEAVPRGFLWILTLLVIISGVVGFLAGAVLLLAVFLPKEKILKELLAAMKENTGTETALVSTGKSSTRKEASNDSSSQDNVGSAPKSALPSDEQLKKEAFHEIAFAEEVLESLAALKTPEVKAKAKEDIERAKRLFSEGKYAGARWLARQISKNLLE